MKRGYLISILVVVLLLLGACTPKSESDLTIPAHFTTYTNEEELFSISYPLDWEVALWAIEDIEQSTKELITSIESDLPVENLKFIFLPWIGLA